MRWISVFLLLLSSSASAHLLDVEVESMEPKPWLTDEGNASFDAPHEIGFPVLDSQAVFAWLDAGDVDVYSFSVTANDFTQASSLGLPTPFIFAAPLPPACLNTKGNYPAIAVIAPFGKAAVEDPAGFDLPFPVPPGHGVAVVYNSRDWHWWTWWRCSKRPVFALPDDDTTTPLNLSWFLPTGCTVEPFDCTDSDSLAVPVFQPTTGYIVVWDPDGHPQDYTLNLGIDESNFQSFPEIEDYVRDNHYLHWPCLDPYP